MKPKLFIFILLAFAMPFVSSQIIFSNSFNPVYSSGDLIPVNISLQSSLPISDYLNSYLVCNGNAILVGKTYLSVYSNEEKSITFSFPASYIGNCNVQSNFNGETAVSEKFVISNQIKLDYRVNDLSFAPGDYFSINGTAIKSDGVHINGTLNISSGLINKTLIIKNGNFSYSFNIPLNAYPKIYQFLLNAKDINPNNIALNFGLSNFTVSVVSIPSKIIINSSLSSFSPPKNITLNFSLYDQGRNRISNKILIMKIFNPSKNIIFNGTFPSYGNYTYNFPSNAEKGFWAFNMYYGSVFSSSEIYVGENSEISYSIMNNNLRISNVGNVPYNGVVVYHLGNSSWEENQSVNVNLSTGGYSDYPLKYNGVYNLSAGGKKLGVFTLTGASIGSSGDLSFNYLFLGVLFFVVLALFFISRKILLLSKINPLPKLNQNKNEITPTSQMISYSAFIHFRSFFEEAKPISEKYGWTLHKADDHLFFVLFYSNEKASASKLLNFSKEILKISRLKNSPVEISINSELFNEDKGMLNHLALKSKKMLDHVKWEIIISKEFAQLLGLKSERKIIDNLNGEGFLAYII